jgi:hypothetical protein
MAEQAEVVAGGGEHGIDTVAVAAFEIVAAQAVIVFEMTNHRLDGSTPSHLASNGLGDTPDLA